MKSTLQITLTLIILLFCLPLYIISAWFAGAIEGCFLFIKWYYPEFNVFGRHNISPETLICPGELIEDIIQKIPAERPVKSNFTLKEFEFKIRDKVSGIFIR